ncbi:Os05g0202000 [Oryza sativa Japonica Group]|jgi:hypothetical protein|uniref:Os05g0202000 protein n=1 Tax=Oryza sativa subsp. japonica TaxID=39947 RepID=A0A0N7KKB1_ORYSJ|nr:Os05g0202000 [Oryza sativa Japonica Group]
MPTKEELKALLSALGYSAGDCRPTPPSASALAEGAHSAASTTSASLRRSSRQRSRSKGSAASMMARWTRPWRERDSPQLLKEAIHVVSYAFEGQTRWAKEVAASPMITSPSAPMDHRKNLRNYQCFN